MERFTTSSYPLGSLGLAMAVIPLNDAFIKIPSAYILLLLYKSIPDRIHIVEQDQIIQHMPLQSIENEM
mgnify:CR=1 FL=1